MPRTGSGPSTRPPSLSWRAPGDIDLDWRGPRELHVQTADGAVDWTVRLGATPLTRAMSAMGAVLPAAAWRSGPVLTVLGRVAGAALRAGRVRLTGRVPNGHQFDANPMLIWFVTNSHAVVDGEDLGPIGPLAEQAHLADFYIPQRGIFAIADAHLTAAKPEPVAGR